MPAISYDITGYRECLNDLQDLPRLQRSVVRAALRAAAKLIANEAKKTAPIRTGRLRDAIGIRPVRSRIKNRLGFLVTATPSGDYKGETFYASFLETGWKIGKRSSAAARAAATNANHPPRERRFRPGLHFLQRSARAKARDIERLVVQHMRDNIASHFTRGIRKRALPDET